MAVSCADRTVGQLARERASRSRLFEDLRIEDCDANRTRVGAGPQMLAASRNATISHSRGSGVTNIAAALRRNAALAWDLLANSCILKI